jgi:hypothetical protein
MLFSYVWQTAVDVARDRLYVASCGVSGNQQIQTLSIMGASSGSMLVNKVVDYGFDNRIQELALDPVTGRLFALQGGLTGNISAVEINTATGASTILPVQPTTSSQSFLAPVSHLS